MRARDSHRRRCGPGEQFLGPVFAKVGHKVGTEFGIDASTDKELSADTFRIGLSTSRSLGIFHVTDAQTPDIVSVRALRLRLHPLGIRGMELGRGGLVGPGGMSSGRNGWDSLDADDPTIDSAGKNLALVGTDREVKDVGSVLVLNKFAHERSRMTVPEVDIAE